MVKHTIPPRHSSLDEGGIEDEQSEEQYFKDGVGDDDMYEQIAASIKEESQVNQRLSQSASAVQLGKSLQAPLFAIKSICKKLCDPLHSLHSSHLGRRDGGLYPPIMKKSYSTVDALAPPRVHSPKALSKLSRGALLNRSKGRSTKTPLPSSRGGRNSQEDTKALEREVEVLERQLDELTSSR
jgi:hypothetical protein